ncbi:WecB/TagA/CpsF family glycosyltransferase [Arthrobacter sp. BHU FT2]|nr:WecB/TagA/CpsF family glycosyltransferase [Arthrobacter sp. BHU FT2]
MADTLDCGRISFEPATPKDAIRKVLDLALDPTKEGTHIHFANAYSVVLAQEDSALASAFSSGMCFPDGKPVVWAMRALHNPSPLTVQQVRGPSFFEDFMRQGVNRGVRHYLLGSTPETLAKLSESLPARIPGVKIVGVSSPPFRVVTDEEWHDELRRIRECGADVVWIGLGTPKQDLIAEKLCGLMPSTYICVGAAFDFSAGNLRHAPKWMQKAGLEWLFRFIQEPKRLWRRYMIGNIVFMVTVGGQWLSSRRRR